jgi:hypothetical protein
MPAPRQTRLALDTTAGPTLDEAPLAELDVDPEAPRPLRAEIARRPSARPPHRTGGDMSRPDTRFADVVVPPTAERWRRGDVRRSDKQVQDVRGAVGDPFLVAGLLSRLHRGKRISDDELKAGYRFRSDCTAAHLDGPRAADISRPRIDGGHRPGELAAPAIYARDRMICAIAELGGLDSPMGSCCWHVLGEDMTVKAWVTTRYPRRRITEGYAGGFVLATLGALNMHYQRGSR